MASWSTRRKSTYAFIFIAFLAVTIGLPGFFLFYKAPSCTDGIRNQSELGIDCGGNCPRLCSNYFLDARVMWARADKTGTGLYNLGAYIVNPNVNGIAENVPYTFRAYDKEGILIVERSGRMLIPPHKNVLAFENAINMDKRVPSRVAFEFTAKPQWEKIDTVEDIIAITDTNYSEDQNGAALDVTLENKSLLLYERIDLYAILYDELGNTVGFSRTNLDTLNPGEKQTLSFTWREPRKGTVTTKEVVPVVGSLLVR